MAVTEGRQRPAADCWALSPAGTTASAVWHGTTKVSEFMTPLEIPVVVRKKDTTLKEANDIIWDHKLNSLPIVDENGSSEIYGFPQGL